MAISVVKIILGGMSIEEQETHYDSRTDTGGSVYSE